MAASKDRYLTVAIGTPNTTLVTIAKTTTWSMGFMLHWNWLADRTHFSNVRWTLKMLGGKYRKTLELITFIIL